MTQLPLWSGSGLIGEGVGRVGGSASHPYKKLFWKDTTWCLQLCSLSDQVWACSEQRWIRSQRCCAMFWESSLGMCWHCYSLTNQNWSQSSEGDKERLGRGNPSLLLPSPCCRQGQTTLLPTQDPALSQACKEEPLGSWSCRLPPPPMLVQLTAAYVNNHCLNWNFADPILFCCPFFQKTTLVLSYFSQAKSFPCLAFGSLF